MDDFNILLKKDEVIEHYTEKDPESICILYQGKKEDWGL